jgi:sensor histidine kinase YesM
MDIPIELEPKQFGLLVAILFFLISFLVNLLQRRYSKTRLDRMLKKEESVVKFLGGIHKYLGKLEHACTLELHGATSPEKLGKAIYVARNKIQSTIADMEDHLRSFRQYRRKEKAQEKQKKRMEKLDQRPSGK